jgi:hypothetical protein
VSVIQKLIKTFMPSTTRDLKVKILKDKFLTKKILQEHQNIHNNLSRV